MTDCECGNEIASRRAELGYRTCLQCGEISARKVAQHKARSVVTMHKSNSVYVGQGDSAKQQAKEIAQMRRGLHG